MGDELIGLERPEPVDSSELGSASSHAPPPSRSASRAGMIIGVLGIAVGVLAFIQVALVKLWFLTHVSITSDESIVGLMSTAILHGHPSAFFWGQDYGGVQPYIQAVFSEVLPANAQALRASSIALGIASSVVIFYLARRVLNDAVLALCVAAVSALFPLANLLQTTYNYGFRPVTYLCIFAAILMAARIERGADAWLSWASVGLILGIGWWSSPEVAYAVVPVAVLLITALIAPQDWWRRLAKVAIVVVAFFVGSLPWWWASLHDHFATLTKSQNNGTTFSGRLHIFIDHVLPTQLGLQQYVTGKALFIAPGGIKHDLVLGVTVVIFAVAIVVAVTQGGVKRAIGLGTLAAPFVYVASPATWFWGDGRYAIYLMPFMLLTVLIGLEGLLRWGRVGLGSIATSATRLVVVVGVIAVMLWTSWQFGAWQKQLYDGYGKNLSSFVANDSLGEADAHKLVAQGDLVGWAGYWTAYRLDYLSGGALKISPTENDTLRSLSLARSVADDPKAVWIFSEAPGPWGNGPRDSAIGPGVMNYTQVTSKLEKLGVGYHVKGYGGIWVVTTDRPVSPSELGMGSIPS